MWRLIRSVVLGSPPAGQRLALPGEQGNMASLNSVSRRRSIGLFLSAGFLVLAAIVAILMWQRPHGLHGSHGDSGTSRQSRSEHGISSSDPFPSPQARPVRPSTAPGRKEVSPFDQQSGALDPEWLASRGIARERLEEATGIVGKYRRLSADALLSRLVLAQEDSADPIGQKVYHFSPLDAGSARPMDEMRAELRTAFGGSPG
ncbi:MAG: hypothetical protein JWO82_3474, partial [Akkermansiaceae bacterium]|nr:hypothetical protein [Akkermansiaceae bacterium]